MAILDGLLEEKRLQLFYQAIEALIKEELRSHYTEKSAFMALIASPAEQEAAKQMVLKKVRESNYQILLDRWPQLRPLYDNLLREHKVMAAEFEELLASYKEEISQKLLNSRPITTIKGITYGAAAFHNHGRLVFVVETDAGKFVYKPHSCAIDLALKNLLEQYCPGFIYIPKVVDAGKCGFCEFIENTPPTTPEAIQSFCYNLGGLAAIAIALGMYDLHSANLLALNTLPVCIDLETALKPKRYSPQSYFPASELVDTVLDTEIFPTSLDCQVQASYKEHILQGFSDAYDIVLSNRKAILEELKAWHFELRVILRATTDYVTLISLLRKPKALEDDTYRFKVLSVLEAPYEQARAEETSLWAGEVPRFYTYSNEYNLYIEDKLVKEDYFASTTIENATSNLERMCEQHKAFEKAIISQCLTRVSENFQFRPCCRDEQEELKEENIIPKQEEIREFLIHVIDKLDASYLPPLNGRRHMLHFVKGSPSLSFMDASFGSGYGGLAYFANETLKLADKLQLPETTKTKLQGFKASFYQAMALKLDHLEKVALFSSSATALGLENGLGGELYVLNSLAEQGKEPRATVLRDRLLVQLEHLELEPLHPQQTSLFQGLSGLLYGLTYCPLTATSEKLIRQVADKLLALKKVHETKQLWLTVNDKRGLSGLGEGMAGIGLAYLSAYEVLAEPRYLAAAKLALEFEDQVYSEEMQTWPDFTRTSVPCEYLQGYVSGAPGLYAFMAKAKAVGLELAAVNLERAKACLLRFGVQQDDSYYCGNASSIEALIMAGAYEEAGQLLGKVLRRYKKLGYMVSDNNFSTPVLQQDLFFGISGLAYAALHYLEPQQVQPIIK